ncbi:DUF7201 family protein [Moritella viscosa]|uniref:tRNA(Ile)-lysidine synthase-tRNA(Ile)-2-lysyl-cytidine synthase-tRNA(Ile)-lysidine synthetase n=1 Tax=Moritella viscosa TaxID=80854 RepID=A0A1L0F5H6_9GAMM|nr:hypothetical protein [Moritella viscosa]SGZ17382.1 tRNA(Ile)-lysidine synthase-tRNA(Ile)-2-lysyl-cytidine synthase-tRNA(Ile)-lysidine synthetase [Moritella viscosa]
MQPEPQPPLYQLKMDADRDSDRADEKSDKILDKLDTNLDKLTSMLSSVNIMIAKHDLSIEHINNRFQERDDYYHKIMVEDKKLMDKQTEDKMNKLEKRINENEKFKYKAVALISLLPIIISLIPIVMNFMIVAA